MGKSLFLVGTTAEKTGKNGPENPSCSSLALLHCGGPVECTRHLRIRHQRPKYIEDRLHTAIPPLIDLGRDRPLDHLPQQVPLLVDPHQSPAVDLSLDFRDAALHIQAVVQLVAHSRRICDVRAEFGVGGFAVHALGIAGQIIRGDGS